MEIGELDVPCFASAPGEANPPLIVDANSVLASSVATKRLVAIAGR